MRLFFLVSVFLLIANIHAVRADNLWYEGGTLQKATVDEWHKATPENQLATSADFIASLSGISDVGGVKDPAALEDVKKRALALRDCVNKAIESGEAMPDAKVAEPIVKCTVMK